MKTYRFGGNFPPAFVISDVYGSTHWKEFLKLRNSGEAIVFLGDYFARRGNGPFAQTDAMNFMEIYAYARGNPNVWLILGNHDYDSFPFARWQPILCRSCEQENRVVLMSHVKLLQPVYTGLGTVIFCHGGLPGIMPALKLTAICKSRRQSVTPIDSKLFLAHF